MFMGSYATEVCKNLNAKAKSVLELADKWKMTGNYLNYLFFPPYIAFLGLLCPRRPYIELFCVEQKVKIIINNTCSIPIFTFIEQKTVN